MVGVCSGRMGWDNGMGVCNVSVVEVWCGSVEWDCGGSMM